MTLPARLRAALAVLVCAAALAFAAVPARAAIDIKEVESPGGITAWLIEDRTVPMVTLQFAFRGGSALDPEGKAGLAEMVSGLLDEGAGSLDSRAFQTRLEHNAIHMRFSAGPDHFGGRLRTLNEKRDTAFDLLRLALTRPRFDPEPVARVRGQLLSEARRAAEQPHVLASRVWYRTVFPDHPYGRPGGGTVESLRAITASDLVGFVERRLARDNLVVGVVGDIAPDVLGRLLDRAFGDLPAASAPGRVPPAEVRGAGNVVVVERDIPQSVVMFGHEGLPRKHPDFYAAFVMNYVLGGNGLTSRLATEIREKRGLAYSVGTDLQTLDHAALIVGHVATANARVGQSLDLIRSEWRRVAEGGITPGELGDAKRYLTGSFYPQLSSTGRLARTLVGIQLDELGIDYLARRNDLIRAVTMADIERVAARLMRPDALTVVAVGRPEGIRPTE